MAVYVISDLHFNHPGILKMERKQFSLVDDHNEYVIRQYNSVVGPNDTCYILGDIGFYNVYDLAPLCRRLNGHKIMIRGNHDRFTDREAKELLGFEEVINHPYYYDDHTILSHEPVREALDNPYVINIHGHIHKTELVKDRCKNYINVNCHMIHYLPINIELLHKKYQNICNKSRQETYGKEWYYDFYAVKDKN